jgi:hypothetical protein
MNSIKFFETIPKIEKREKPPTNDFLEKPDMQMKNQVLLFLTNGNSKITTIETHKN